MVYNFVLYNNHTTRLLNSEMEGYFLSLVLLFHPPGDFFRSTHVDISKFRVIQIYISPKDVFLTFCFGCGYIYQIDGKLLVLFIKGITLFHTVRTINPVVDIVFQFINIRRHGVRSITECITHVANNLLIFTLTPFAVNICNLDFHIVLFFPLYSNNRATINFRYSIEFLYQVVAQFDYLNSLVCIKGETTSRAFCVRIDFAVLRAEIYVESVMLNLLVSSISHLVEQFLFTIRIWIGIIVYHYSGGNSECYKICFHNSITVTLY